MSTGTRAGVEEYISHFRDQIQGVRSVQSALYKKILIVTMLDALAKGRYPGTPSNGSRFIRLIEEYSDWRHAKLINWPQLEMMILDQGGPKKLGLSAEFMKKLSGGNWRRRNPYQLAGFEHDPKREEILPAPCSRKEEELVDRAKHSARLYAYRCTLVDEFREPGHGFEFDENALHPYYHICSDAGPPHKVTIETVYPTGWFLSLVPPILDGLSNYYRSTNINPYDSHRFGSPWR